MPEIKHGFTGGKMNKDLDERLVPNGEYRDAMNVEVSTSEGSDVGTVQNILGNKEVPIDGFTLSENCYTIGSVADEKNDKLYYLITDIFQKTGSVSYIVEYTRGQTTPIPVLVDLNNILKFNTDMTVTGINIIDDMMFWTDNTNEPKKINIPRCIQGTNNDWTSHTKLINESQGIDLASNLLLEEKHVTVIKKAPITPLSMQLVKERLENKIYTGVIDISISDAVSNSFKNTGPGQSQEGIHDFSTFNIGDVFVVGIEIGIDAFGNEIDPLGNIGASDGLTGWHKSSPDYTSSTSNFIERSNILPGTKVVLSPYDDNLTPPSLPINDFVIKGVVEDRYPDDDRTTGNTSIGIKITTIDGFPPGILSGFLQRKYAIDLFDESDKLFEFKFPRFSYRYKFEDGEYSPFAPFTQVAFSPGSFDYHPRKGYNLGMVNTTKEVVLNNLITNETPLDVVSVDVLFKDEVSPIIYVVETIRANDVADTSVVGALNLWDKLKSPTSSGYKIEKETINSVVPSNQLLRSFDNVPRKALAQDITGSRIVYGNYVQNYDLIGMDNKKYQPGNIELSWDLFIPTVTEEAAEAKKSIKSLREYQLGVVFTDEYGRQTPVISNASGTLKLEKQRADKNNRINVSLANQLNKPQNLSYMKFFVKETEGEYYNMAMDRFYDAEDGNIWLSFPSSDRNKVDIDSFIILKKGSDQDTLVTENARYKVIAVENEAPDFIKLNKILAVEETHVDGDNDLFGGSTQDVPLQGRSEFKAFYRPFLNSPGADLPSYSEGQLFVEFAELASEQVSDRYRVSSIASDREIIPDPTGATSGDNLSEAQYSFKLARPLSQDVNFISNDPTGLNPTNINDGSKLNIYKYEVDNQAKFDGRFFVKIYLDGVFRDNIGKSFKEGLKQRVVQSKKIYYMDKFKHVDRMTDELDNGKSPFGFTRQHKAQTDGRAIEGGSITNGTVGEPILGTTGNYKAYRDYDERIWNPSTLPGSTYDQNKDYFYGYYAIPDFLSFAFYFDRYQTGYDLNGEIGVDPSLSKAEVSNGSNQMAYFKHLERGGASGHVYSNGDDFDSEPFEVEYLDETWRGAEDWGENFATYTFGVGKGYSNYFATAGGVISPLFSYSQSWDMNIFDNDFREGSRDAEVWFIDKGPRQGRRKGHDMYWKGVEFSPGFNKGISFNDDGSWDMDLGFGGIIGSPKESDYGFYNSNDNFWNIADWNTPAGESVNTDYNSGEDVFWADQLEPGVRFRFREDPAGTIYVISSNVSGYNWLRHSTLAADSDGLVDFYDGVQNVEGRHVFAGGGQNMAPYLPHNFTKNWRVRKILPALTAWNPTQEGELTGAGQIITLTIASSSGNITGGGTTATGDNDQQDLVIYVQTTLGENSGVLRAGSPQASLHTGMALKRYTRKGDGSNANGVFDTIRNNIPTNITLGGGTVQEFWVIRDIKKIGDHYALTLGGYTHPLSSSRSFFGVTINGDYAVSSPALGGFHTPKIGGNYEFVQVGMNSYSPNSEFNMNTMGRTLNQYSHGHWGAIGAVGYTIDVVENIEPELVLSENPAIWETEPKEIKALDIYYEASASIPMEVNKSNMHEAFPIDSFITVTSALNQSSLTYRVTGYRSDDTFYIDKQPNLSVSRPLVNAAIAPIVHTINRPDGLSISIQLKDGFGEDDITGIMPNQWYVQVKQNLYTSKFRLPWYNCYSFGNGVESNRIRDNFNLPFITNGVKVSTTLEHEYEEEHRKYGLIYSGIYNSTSGVSNLNQFIAGEKITKDINPIYGSIQKLHSRDGDLVTLCEDKILKILANKDAVFNADGNTNLTATNRVLGQTTPFSGEYGISTNPESFASENYRAYFTDRIRGTVMRLSMDGLTPISDAGMKDWFRDNLKLVNGRIIGSYDDRNDEYNVKLEILEVEDFALVNKSKVVTYKEDVRGWVSFKSFIDMQHGNSMGNDYYTFKKGKLYKHYDEIENRNTFYDEFASSSVDVLLNDIPSSIKVFSTLNYEGSQAKVDKFSYHQAIVLPYQDDTFYSDQEYYNLSNKKGWHVESILTNDEEGYINEFLDKESKWFNYIKKETNLDLIKADAGDFSFQGIGEAKTAAIIQADPINTFVTARFADPSAEDVVEDTIEFIVEEDVQIESTQVNKSEPVKTEPVKAEPVKVEIVKSIIPPVKSKKELEDEEEDKPQQRTEDRSSVSGARSGGSGSGGSSSSGGGGGGGY